MKEKLLSVRLDEELYAKLVENAKENHKNISEYVRYLLLNDEKRVKNEVTYLERSKKEVDRLLGELSKIRNEENFLEHWRKLLSTKEPVCPKCGKVGGPIRQTFEGEIVGCDYCLKIKGY